MIGWISVKDRLPEFISDKDYSDNVLCVVTGYNNKSYISVFNRCIVDSTEDSYQWAWAKISQCFGDLRDADCEFDDDYEVTHWMPIPEAPSQA